MRRDLYHFAQICGSNRRYDTFFWEAGGVGEQESRVKKVVAED